MRRRAIRRQSSSGGEHQALVATWMLRVILGFDWVFKGFFVKKSGFQDRDVSDFLDLSDLDEEKITVAALRKRLKKQLSDYSSKLDTPMLLQKNIELLSGRVELSLLQREIILFAVLIENTSVWNDLFRNVQINTEEQFLRVLSCAVDADLADVKVALAKRSFLRRSGMLTFDKNYYEDGKVGVMDQLQYALLADNDSEEALLEHLLLKAKEPSLTLEDYPHVSQDIDSVSRILKAASAHHEEGVNILLYGSPGTGKSELARLLANTLHFDLFEVRTEDGEGDPMRSDNRLSSYRLSQQLLAQYQQGLILFDEVEDIFPARAFSFFGMELNSGKNKGWMNKALEENKTPAIWVCNRVEQIDPAFLRRFDYVMELSTPPKEVRTNMIRSYLQAYNVSESFIDRLASHRQLSPAHVEKISKAARRIEQDGSPVDEILERVMNNSFKAMGMEQLSSSREYVTHYDLGYLNTNIDIQGMVDGLSRVAKGNICFYGAPGTGKTALAGHIAKAMGVPLICKRASDILGMYVGQSEKNIARMFREAKQEEAVLFLDEADSLLRDRRGANQSWEVSQVNELLIQMENFDGLFICSTNLMEDLDQASLRRFALKVKFDYLTTAQACKMLEQEVVGKVGAKHRQIMSLMECLAPGDFAAVKKRLNILGIEPSPEAMIRELKEEVSIKQVTRSKPIGFC